MNIKSKQEYHESFTHCKICNNKLTQKNNHCYHKLLSCDRNHYTVGIKPSTISEFALFEGIKIINIFSFSQFEKNPAINGLVMPDHFYIDFSHPHGPYHLTDDLVVSKNIPLEFNEYTKEFIQNSRVLN